MQVNINNTKAEITIIGAGLTGLTLAFYLSRAGKKVLLLEKSNRTGGVIKTEQEKGFLFETGPNTGVIGTTEIVELFEDLKDNMTIETANQKAKFRWILKNGKWKALPSGLISGIKTPLFSFKDKFRILAEPFRKRGTNKNETVAELVKRRMGKSYLEYAIDPFISGIYAGDPEKLITRFALPKLYKLEQNYGSFIKGAIKKRKEPKTEIEKKVNKEVFSIKGGLQKMVDALSDKIGEQNIITECSDISVQRNGASYNLNYKNRQGEVVQVESEQVVSTIGGNDLATIFSFLSDNEIKTLTNTLYAKVIQVVACFSNWKGKDLKAFGGLIPSKEKRNCLGILFPSSIFANRMPKNGAILSIFIGGIKKPEMIDKSDKEIENIALSEIHQTLDTNDKPDLLKIYRYKQAIPQYDYRTEEILNTIDEVQKNYSGLILAGNIRDGIGMADRIKQGRIIADQIINQSNKK